MNLVIDRIMVRNDEDEITRFADSVQTAFSIGKGVCRLKKAG